MISHAFIFRDFSKKEMNGLVKIVSARLKGFEVNSFALGCSFSKNLSEKEIAELRQSFQFLLVELLEKKLKAKADYEKHDAEILIDFNSGKISFYIRPVFVYGIYKKFSRELPQTIYYCYKCKGRGIGCDFCKGTGRLAVESVQEILGKYLMKAFNAMDNKFHGSGREDVDVRMLGNGREFVTELIEPKKRKLSAKQFRALEKKINKKEKKKLAISKLKIVLKERVAELKAAAHEKVYEMLIDCDSDVEAKELERLKEKLKRKFFVEQRTPVRVEKRRSDLTRVRKAELLKLKKISAKKFSIRIEAASGLYVKEFVSGDSGRTSPSISALLKKNCICKELDVVKILR